MYCLPKCIELEEFSGIIESGKWYSYKISPPEDTLLAFDGSLGEGFFAKNFWYNKNGSYYWNNHQQSHPEVWMIVEPKPGLKYIRVDRYTGEPLDK